MEVKERFGVTWDDAREEGKEEGQKNTIRGLILDQEFLGLTEDRVINFIMKRLNYSEAEARELYDELAKNSSTK